MKLALGKNGPIVAQLAIAVLAMLAVAFAPPAYGRMLLIPLDGRPVSQARLAELQATPLKPGSLPGSQVVEGRRAELSGLWAQRVLVLAAPAALCSSG